MKVGELGIYSVVKYVFRICFRYNMEIIYICVCLFVHLSRYFYLVSCLLVSYQLWLGIGDLHTQSNLPFLAGLHLGGWDLPQDLFYTEGVEELLEARVKIAEWHLDFEMEVS